MNRSGIDIKRASSFMPEFGGQLERSKSVRLATVALLLMVLVGWLNPSSNAFAVELREFKSEEQRQRFHDLVAELRCTVCQNQSLADSDADLARDLRQRVHELLDDGRSDEEIIAYMVDRFTSFIRYRPPFTAETAALWIGPFAIFALGLLLLFSQIRKHRSEAQQRAGELSGAERQRLAALLNGSQQDES